MTFSCPKTIGLEKTLRMLNSLETKWERRQLLFWFEVLQSLRIRSLVLINVTWFFAAGGEINCDC